MTEVEMEHILEKASNNYKSGGLFKSEARGGLTPEDSFKPSDGRLFRHINVAQILSVSTDN